MSLRNYKLERANAERETAVNNFNTIKTVAAGLYALRETGIIDVDFDFDRFELLKKSYLAELARLDEKVYEASRNG